MRAKRSGPPGVPPRGAVGYRVDELLGHLVELVGGERFDGGSGLFCIIAGSWGSSWLHGVTQRLPRAGARHAGRVRAPESQRGTGAPASASTTPTTPAPTSVETIPRRAISSTTAAAARRPNCQVSRSAAPAGSRPEDRADPAGPAPARNAARALVRIRRSGGRRSTRTRTRAGTRPRPRARRRRRRWAA